MLLLFSGLFCLSGCLQQKNLNPDFASGLMPKTSLSGGITEIQLNSDNYPDLSLSFRLFEADWQPISTLSAEETNITPQIQRFNSPFWGNEPAKPLNMYLQDAKLARTGIYKLESIPARKDEIIGRLLIMFHLKPEGTLQIVDPVAKQMVNSLISNINPNTQIRLANITPETELFATSWMNNPADINAVVGGFAPIDKGIKVKLNEKAFNQSVMTAIDHLNEQVCDGPKWLVLITQGDQELAVALNDSIVSSLSKANISLYVQAINLKKPPQSQYNLKSATEYTDGSVFLGEDLDYMKELRRSFDKQVHAFANNRYRIKWWDSDFSQTFPSRSYQFTVSKNAKQFEHTVAVTPSPDILKAWRDKEIMAVKKAIQTGDIGDLHGVVKAILQRYPTNEVNHLFGTIHDRTMKLALGNSLRTGLILLNRLEAIFGKNNAWRKIFHKDYENIGDHLRKKGYAGKAIKYYKKSNRYKTTQNVYEKILKCQIKVFDFYSAQQSAEWIYDNGDLSGRSTKFTQDMAFAYSSGLEFVKAEKLTRRGLLNLDKSDPAWNYCIMLIKGLWYGGTAKIINESIPALSRQSDFVKLLKDLKSQKDIVWTGYINSKKIIQYSSKPVHLGRKFSDLYPYVKKIPFSNIRDPIFISRIQQKNQLGMFLIPGKNDAGFTVLTFDTSLEFSEKQSFLTMVNDPADDSLWRAFKNKIAYRCGSTMTKTMGSMFKFMKLSPNNWSGTVVKSRRLCPKEIQIYSIVAGRKESHLPIAAINTISKAALPATITQAGRANENPYYMAVERKMKNKTIHEFTTAVYLENQWLGVHRIGYNW